MKKTGEFRKQIIRKWEKKTEMKFLDAHSHIPLSMFMEIVNEAREDFPSGWIEAHASEILEWFEKWFGEVE